MNRWIPILLGVLFVTLFALGCSGGGGNPVTPGPGNDVLLTDGTSTPQYSTNAQEHKNLWGFFDAYFDTVNETFEIMPNHTVAGIVNATGFFNNNPTKFTTANLSVIPSDPPGTYVDADIDVILEHPFAGVPKFSGYDVHMALITDGSGTMAHDGVTYGVEGTDVVMMDDPVNGDGGGPDGFTRWFNPTEFTTPGVLGYVEGAIATPGWSGNATLNPYKMYVDGMTATTDAFDFVSTASGTGNNIFESGGAPVPRNMYIRFPIGTPPVIKVNYAIIASWDGPQHPTPVNAVAVVAASAVQTDGIYWTTGPAAGSLILDISLAGYGYQPSSIVVESSVLSAPYTAVAPTATGGGATYSTYHVEIPADATLTSADGHTAWVIAEYGGADLTTFGYENLFSVVNGAGTDPLAAYFNFPVVVGDTPPNATITCDGKNILLRAGVGAHDLSVDHGNGDILVLFDDGEVWRFPACGAAPGALSFTTTTDHVYMDTAPNGNTLVNGSRTLGPVSTGEVYDPAGIQFSGDVGWPTYYSAGIFDAMAMVDTSALNDNTVCSMGFFDATGTGTQFRLRTYHDTTNYAYLTSPANWWSMTAAAGAGLTQIADLVALESMPGPDPQFIILDTNDYNVERYELTTPANYTGITNQGWVCGTGQSDAISGFNDPKDITRDSANRLHVLDLLSTGEPAIKKYREEGYSVGIYGDSTSIAGDPLRIEASDYDQTVYVLHEIAGTAYVSVFPVAEQPAASNLAPQILSGVDGNDSPFVTDPYLYSVSAMDPDADPLNYNWIVTDPLLVEQVNVNQPGDSYLVDWTLLGALAGEIWTVDCLVDDGVNTPVAAATKTCTMMPGWTIPVTKNIPLRPGSGASAYDMSLDPGDGDLLVLYDDGQIWRSTPGGGFADEVAWATGVNLSYRYLDIAPDGVTLIGGSRTLLGLSIAEVRDGTGTIIPGSSVAWPTYYEHGIHDVVGFNTTDPAYTNWVMTQGFGNTNLMRGRLFGPPNNYTYLSNFWADYAGTGYGLSWTTEFVACDTAPTNPMSIYILDGAPDYTVERHEVVQGWYGGGNVPMTNIIGQSQSDTTAGFNDPRDIVMSGQAYICVLDELSTLAPAVKVYNADGSARGIMGDAVSIANDPLRIAAGDLTAHVFVLHEDLTGNAFLSIFEPAEIP